ncbi:hypothetical protein [Polymorphobacter megasporae]|uniref:hypothetical protein n=1 Tax=Glacieibacterium megasporae TaxID=2835787 RepID=UPI001C1E0EA2|nr:hypothetical protein [Polymorphobacter megasporae]UAJ11039.1 hypothetical protein KTC28_04815 [Polymorphobacter megasporae]
MSLYVAFGSGAALYSEAFDRSTGSNTSSLSHREEPHLTLAQILQRVLDQAIRSSTAIVAIKGGRSRPTHRLFWTIAGSPINCAREICIEHWFACELGDCPSPEPFRDVATVLVD